MIHRNCNYVSDILEEIALEGLDGITINALWARLNDRPNFVLKPIDDETKSFLWRAIRRLASVNFYLLLEPRQPLVIFNRFTYVDACGNFYEPDDGLGNIYPHCPIDENGIMGSCSTFRTRNDITNKVRDKSLDEVVMDWGESLVIVANQVTRKSVLCTPDHNPLTEITVLHYCFLERIGRSRYNGEVTQGKYGLQTISEDSKMLFYYRKFLSKHKLITKQIFHLRVGKINCSGSLLHLPRFCTIIKSKFTTDIEKLIQFIRDKPEKYALYKDVQKHFNNSIDLKKLLMKLNKVIKSEMVPYRTIHPDAKQSEWKLKVNGMEKSIKILRLIESNIPDNTGEEEDEEEVESNGLLNESGRLLNRTILRQGYSVIEKCGNSGLAQAGLAATMGVSALQARSVCKQLVKKDACRTILIDIGRQRIGHFFSKKFDSHKSSKVSEVSEEKNKLLQIIVDSEVKLEKTEHFVQTELDNNSSDTSGIISKPTSSVVEKNTSSQLTLEESNSIETEIIVSNPNVSGERSFPSLTEEVKSLGPHTTSNSLTYRILKRANLIMRAVNTHKVIHDPQKLQRLISEEEESEGFNYTVDRKTVLRLMEKLEEDGHIRTIKVNLKGFGKEKNMVFICHPSITEEYSEIKSAIEQAKMKLPIITRETIKSKMPKATDALNGSFSKTETNLKEAAYKYEYKAGRKYGYKTKYVRMKILHTYMFYLIYGYNGNENLDQKIKYEILEGMGLDKSLADEMAFVYNQTDDWKMFIPPLPVHQDYCEGWCLMSDLLLRLPLCLFVALSNVPYNIPNLVEYIQHPIRKYYLVKYLPSDIANHLTIMRKYIFSISDIILRLCYIGLVQMGPQRLKEKDQVFIYLNRNACLLDTTSSEFGYNHISQHLKYEQLNYTFKTLDDVDQYWYDLWNIAMNTNLGCRNVMTGQAIVLEPINTKSVLVEAAQSRTPAEARDRDVGYIPGDGLGAVGLDSDMFVHLKRNWYWNNDVKCEPDTSQKSILDPPSIKRPLNKTPRKIKIPEARHPSPPRKKIKNTSETELLNMNMLKKPAWKRANKAKKVTRIMKPKTSKHGRKPYYDQVDREALRRMVKLRVDWSLQEDNLLLICKVASLYMCPDKRRQVLKNFCAVREILHETFPETSRNKTSRACQRRQLYMMKNPSTTHSVYLCLEEIKQDDEITEKFEKAVENLDAEVKAQGEGIMTFQEKYDEIFINLVRTLMRKLKTVERNEKTGLIGITIPNTKQEFYNMFNIIIPRNLAIQGRMFNEVQNTVDIICGVVNTVIHSSLCCSGDKTNYSYQLFHIYQQYPDKLLRSVMAKCRSMSIVSCRKKSKRWKTTCDACLPLSSSPYQLSITYVNILHTKYQYQIFSECYGSLQEIFNKHKKQEISLIADSSRAISSAKDSTVPLDNPESDQLPENKDLSGYIELEVSSGGGCANIVELYSAGFVNMKITFPEHLIILDPRLSEDKDNYFQLMERFRELISMSKGSRKTRKDRQLTDGKNDEDDDEDDFEDEDAFSDDPLISSSKDEAGDKDDCDEFNLASKAGVAKAASRLAVYMMRDEPLESLDKTLQHAHDYFVLNPCKISVKITNEEKAITSIINDKLKESILYNVKRFAVFPENHVENVEIIDQISKKYPSLNINPLRQLVEFFEAKRELGATHIDIEDNIGNSADIHNILNILVDHQYLLKSGTVNVRFIHNKFTKPWLIRSYQIPRIHRESLPMEQAQVLCLPDEAIPEKKIKLDNKTLDKNAQDANDYLKDSAPTRSIPCDDQQIIADATSDVSVDGKMQAEYGSKSTNNENLLQINETNNFPNVQNHENLVSTKEINDKIEEQPSTKLNNNSSGKILLQFRKRKWINLPKSSVDKINDLDYSQVVNVQVVIRPWIRVDGSLNRRVLDRLLGSVLGHCLSAPGTTIEKLKNRFTPALQPVHTLELVEILEKLGCIHLCVVKTLRKPSLTSQRSEVYTAPFTGFEKMTSTIIEPDLLAVSKLGHFIGEKAYKTDYLDKITNFKLSK